MKVYLVGGAVRDELLGLIPKEKDWVVVGATPDDMLRMGYKQVGKEFPVFLHPKTGEEYALARTEKKVAPGYTGFVFSTSPEVTLEEDLQRRDLTINAIAKIPDGQLVDPYCGQQDLQDKILRHVSLAFVEDPVRILRIARFAARYADRGFKVAPETYSLMKKMVAAGEVDALVPERVWKEFERALGEYTPEVFFEVLAKCGALAKLFPMIKTKRLRLFAKFSGIQLLKRVAQLTSDKIIRFSALTQSFSKEDITWLCKRYRLPIEYCELALFVNKYYSECLGFDSLAVERMLAIFSGVDAFRREERFNKFLKACQVIAKCRKETFPAIDIKNFFSAAKAIDVKELLEQKLKGAEIGEKLKEKRLEAIAKLQNIRPK